MNILDSISNYFYKPVAVTPTVHLPEKNILSKIEQIGANKIADLSFALSQLIIVNLGDYASERYSQIAKNFKQEIDINSVNSWEQDYLACNDRSRFYEILQKHISTIIAEAFSRPLHFLENGLQIVLAEDEPVGPLLAVLNETEMPRFKNDMPKNYEIFLTVGQQSFNGTGDLFFDLTQKIQDLTFYSISFKL